MVNTAVIFAVSVFILFLILYISLNRTKALAAFTCVSGTNAVTNMMILTFDGRFLSTDGVQLTVSNTPTTWHYSYDTREAMVGYLSTNGKVLDARTLRLGSVGYPVILQIVNIVSEITMFVVCNSYITVVGDSVVLSQFSAGSEFFIQQV